MSQMADLPPARVLQLEIGGRQTEARPLLPGIRSFRLEQRSQIRAALRSIAFEAEAAAPSLERAGRARAAAGPRPHEEPLYTMSRPLEELHTSPDAEARYSRDYAMTRFASLKWIRWPRRSKPGPDVVQLGASAPTRARPGDEFSARFSAYHPALTHEAKRALRQPGARTDANQAQTTWRTGGEVRVVLTGEHIKASPSEQKFTWDGLIKTVQFDVRVEGAALERTRVLLRFDVHIQGAVVARVRLPLSIDSKPGLWEKLLVPEEQFFAQSVPQTAYASYEIADKTDVMQRIDAITQHAGIRFFAESLSLDPSTKRKEGLQKTIGAQDLFILFWSWAAAKSAAVEWEWRTALKSPGQERMEAQRLKPNDPEPVLPPELRDLGTPKGTPTRMEHANKRYFVVGCVLSVFVAGLIVWAFALRTLTSDQRTLMRVLLSLFSGFAAGSFVGSLTVKARGLIPGIAATATGGFGVWLLTAFVMLPNASTFDVVVQPHGPAGMLDIFKVGTVSLQVREQLKRLAIDKDGQARFVEISSKFQGEQAPVRVEIPGFQMKEPEQRIVLRQGEAVFVPMILQRRVDTAAKTEAMGTP